MLFNKFDEVYSGDRPGFIEGYESLKSAITLGVNNKKIGGKL